MKKYIRIYVFLMRLNLSAVLAYRASFTNNLIGTLGWSIVSIASMYLLTYRAPHVFSWTRAELLAATGTYSIVIGIFGTLFSKNFNRFSRIIHLGELDGILLKPLDSQFSISLWIFNYASLFRIMVGTIFTTYILSTIHAHITLLSFLTYFVFVVSGVLLLYTVWFLTVTITIWLTNLSNIVDFLYNINNLGRYPSETLRQTNNFFIMLFIPLTFVATLPIKAILQKAMIADELLMFFCVSVLFFLSRKFWKFALRSYTSASG